MEVSGGDRRRILGQSPFRPRAVIDCGSGVSEQIEPERHHAGGDAGGAAGHDRALQVDAGGGKSRGKRVGRNESAAVGMNEVGPWNVGGVRDVPELLEWEYVFLAAVEFAGAARVDHLRRAG